jgi:hypothetical protein
MQGRRYGANSKKLGLDAYIKENSSIEELKGLVDKDIPVIVAWHSPEEGGHYSIVVGFKDDSIF